MDSFVDFKLDTPTTTEDPTLKRSYVDLEADDSTAEDIDVDDEEAAENFAQDVNDLIAAWMDINLSAFIEKYLREHSSSYPKNSRDLSNAGYRTNKDIFLLQQNHK